MGFIFFKKSFIKPRKNMINLIKSTMLLILAVVLTNCDAFVDDDDELSMYRVPYESSELQINGYYYQLFNNDTKMDIYLFYRNGILLSVGTTPIEDIDIMEKNLRNETYISTYKSSKTHWGVYYIQGDSIAFEKWFPSMPPTQAYIRIGKILNDKTFQMTKLMRSNGSERMNIDEIYHFKIFDGKPDSTNRFIK